MSFLPERWPAQVRHGVKQGLMVVATGGLVVGSVGVFSDGLIGAVIDQVRPRLERQIGQAMGHPLRLGPYQGLGFDGLKLGPSGFLKGAQDDSTVSAQEVLVGIDPLASWRRRALVLDLSFVGAQADLRRNAKGQIWVLGPSKADQPPPRLDLTFRLPQPARARLWNVAPSSKPLEISAVGRVGLSLYRQELDLRTRLRLPGHKGSAAVSGSGQWKEGRWKADLALQRLALDPLNAFLPVPKPPPGAGAMPPSGEQQPLSGHAEGRIALQLNRGVVSCRGDLRLRRLRWQPGASGDALRIDRLPVGCRDQRLEVAASRWTFGQWRGMFAARLTGDLALAGQLRAQPPPGTGLGTLPITASLRGQWHKGALAITQLKGRRGASNLELSGKLASRVELTGQWRLAPAELPNADRLPSWLLDQPLAGTLRAEGRLASPRIRVETGQPDQALLGPWRAALSWSDQMLRLEELKSENLEVRASLPIGFQPGRGVVIGEMLAKLSLKGYPLERLEPVLGTGLQGEADVSGRVRGLLNQLQPDLALQVENPGAGPLLFGETWRGRLQPGAAGGHQLTMAALEPGLKGRIHARLDRRWQPVSIDLSRRAGQLQLTGTPRSYRWTARSFPLQGLAVSMGPQQPFQPLLAKLSGSGSLGLQPLAFEGHVALDRPQFLGLGGKRIAADVSYADRRYLLKGSVEPIAVGTISADVSGRWEGPFVARFSARRLNSVVFQQLAKALPILLGDKAPPRGVANDLGTLAVGTVAGTIDELLLALERAQARLLKRDLLAQRASRSERLAQLQTRLDADLTLQGPDLATVEAELDAIGHFWLHHQDRAEALASQPFQVRLRGPIVNGEGTFSLSGLSLSLLALLTPVPESLRGSLAARGTYRLGGKRPELGVELALHDTTLAEQTLVLERGGVTLEENGLALDLALRAEAAKSSVDLSGSLPLATDEPGLELRIASRGDGLRFLTALADKAVSWKQGSADLQLLVRGSLAAPIANGFLRLRNGEWDLIGQEVRDLEATVLFDFEQLLVQELSARVGEKGQVTGEGKLGLVRPLAPEPTLAFLFKEVPFALERIRAQGDGEILLSGSLAGPVMGGNVAISRGTINAQPGRISVPEDGQEPESDQPVQPVTVPQLVEANWDFQQPLVLLGPDVESTTGESLRKGMPRLGYLAFNNLRIRLGPDLRVKMGSLANFNTGGQLRIGGRLDPSLEIAGVVKLLQGTMNLFTTTFNLDPDSPNVAVFTPSLGLIPYLDIAMRTRVSDSLDVLGTSGPADASERYAAEASGQSSTLDQLNLVLISVSVSGPADRVAETLDLRSSPPLSMDRLVALIGGNSLAGLSGGNAGGALATVVGEALLSPLLSSLTSALGQRVSLALYPTYVSPKVDSVQEVRSRRVPPQLVLGTEVGVDLTRRIKASVLAAPNRTDVPPRLTMNYKANENLNLEGAIDTQGSWETKLRVLLRF